MIFTLSQITSWLLHYKYFALFPIMVIEGPIITLIAGFLASLKHLNLAIAYAVIVAGDLTGDVLYYCLGRWGTKRLLKRWEHYDHLKDHFRSHRAQTLILGKLSHFIGIPILIAAGSVQVPFGEFLWFNFLATLPKSLTLILIGFFFGRVYHHTSLILVILALLLSTIYIIIQRISHKYEALL